MPYWTCRFNDIHLYLKFLLLIMEQTQTLLPCIDFYIKLLKEQKLIILLLRFLHNSHSEVGWFICFS